MIKKRVLLAMAFMPLFAGIASAQALPGEIKIATEGAYPPWNYTNADGSLTGYEIDLTHALCERMKVKCTIVSQEWNGIIPGLTVGKYDAIIASMGVTPERKKVIAFSKSYAKAPNGFLTTSDNDLKSLADAGHAFDLIDSPADAQAAIDELKLKLKARLSACRPDRLHRTLFESTSKGWRFEITQPLSSSHWIWRTVDWTSAWRTSPPSSL